MWEVTVYKDYGHSVTSYTKSFKYEDDAYDFFEGELKEELEYELGEGLLSDQEFQNIVNAEKYIYSDSTKEIYIAIDEYTKQKNNVR